MSQEVFNNLGSVEISRNVPVCKVPFRFMPSVAVFGKIYLPEKLFDSYRSENPSPEAQAMIVHELTHIQRLGTSVAIYLKYWSDGKFRFQEELAAIRNEMGVLKKHQRNFDIDKRAKMLSGIGYLWCTSYEIAKNRLEQIWLD